MARDALGVCRLRRENISLPTRRQIRQKALQCAGWAGLTCRRNAVASDLIPSKRRVGVGVEVSQS
eukprot:scaffold6701_cov118-Isochrysis_galbana.AAC.3